MEGRIRGREKKLTRVIETARRGWTAAASVVSKAVPPREVLIATVVAGLAFGLGLAFGRATAPSGLPRNPVTIERINLREPGTPPPDTSAGSEAEAGTDEATGVVGPVPADAGVRASSQPQTSPVVTASSPRAGPAPRPTSSQAPSSSREEKMLMPVQGRIVSEFGWRRHPVFADWRYHTGIDIGAADGTPVKAALSGKVLEVSTDRELGLYVLIEHRGGMCTKYGHLGSSSASPGEEVAQGESIGKSGSSGIASGSYLHFEVIRAGKVQDPRDFL